MAGTVKEAKKGKKKRRLKRSIRKTLGALFMATALVIAAIPVDNLQAADPNNMARAASVAAGDASAQVTTNSISIPQITRNETIYTSGDQIYQFAYVTEGDRRVAVITGYAGGQLDEGKLTIPDEVAAYKQYTVSQGTTSGFAAVGQNGCFLFYRRREQVIIAPNDLATTPTDAYPDYYKNTNQTTTDNDGNVTGYIFTRETGEFLPCYLANIGEWEKYEDRELYYDKTVTIGDPSTYTNPPDATQAEANAPFQRTRDQNYQRIRGAKVYYISNQYKDDNGDWQPITEATPEKGVFAGATNVSTVKFGKEFKGIGDYAFYGVGLTTLDLEESNGLNTIGKGAFQNCIRLNSVKLFSGSPMSEVGESAFKGCSELASFTLPWSVSRIGNSAFEDCIKLQTVDLCSDGTNTDGTTNSNMLTKIGVFAFKGCELLQSVTLPAGVSDELYLSIFEGCTALQYICTRNGSLKFKADGDYYTFDNFKTDVGDEFYFEGLATSAIHDQAREQCIPFSYLAIDEKGNYYRVGQWEITLPDEDGTAGLTNTFVVTSDNVLCSYSHSPEDGATKTIIIPSKIGPLEINKLGEEVFLNKCNLETVVIPNTVNEIRDRTFLGCHNLEDIIFDGFEGLNVTVGSDAFLTQYVAGSHDASCNGTIQSNPDENASDAIKALCITGPISAEFGPYKYARAEGNYFTSGSQAKKYISYYSGWPRNLEVRYNEATHMSELWDFPAVSELSSSKYTADKYRYLSIPGKDNEYEVAISNAFSNYQTQGYNLANLTPNERDIIETALNIVIPEGVQSIKEGLIKEKEDLDETAASTHPFYKTITAQSLISVTSPQEDSNGEIVPKTGTFAGCKNLTSITLNSVTYGEGNTVGLTEVGDYVFRDCEGLTQVALPATVKEMGVVPFRGCKGLSFVNFQNNPDFACENAIIYGPAADGTEKGKLIECLEGRSTPFVGGTELSGVTELGKEAFIGTGVVEVDLTESSVTTIPEKAFAKTEKLYKVSLPYTVVNFDDYAFDGSGVNNFVVRSTSSVMRSGPNAFTGLLTNNKDVIWQAAPDTVAQEIGDLWNFNVMDLDTPIFYKVTFYYWDNEQKKDVQIDADEQYSSVDDVVFPAQVGDEVEKPIDGVTQKAILTEWTFVQSGNNWLFTAQYAKPQWKVSFVDPESHFDPLEIWVANGGNAMNNPEVIKLLEDMASVGITGFKCNDGDLTQVTKDLTATADYGTEHTLTVQGGTMQDGSTTGSFEAGEKIIIIADTPEEGNEFSTWSSLPDLSATTILNKANPQTVFTMPNEDIVVIAEFRNINSGGTDSSRSYALTVRNGSGSGTYKAGEQVIITADPAPAGQSFNEWTVVPSTTVLLDKDKSETVITMPESNVTVMANYRNGSGSGSDDPNASPGPSTSPGPGTNSGELHSLVVHNGNNSGSYRAGQQIIVVANDPPAGQEFSSWTVSPAATVVTDKSLSAIVVTMPDNDVALVANYKAIPTGSGNSTGTGNTTGSSNNNKRPSGNAVISGNTQVVVDKNGISNTGVVQATVNGSSDNFVIKVTENSEATAAVLKALLAEFGNLDTIKYVPMDISLYDSTGTRKITDTKGLSITLTLPLPDSLIPYAGNNRVAGVVNDRLDKLSPRFTTINGVSCIVFTAEHFSPYVIYVDTGNAASSGTVSDSTPKTGDGIHPKWFLSIGLASLSFVMFMQKDDKKSKKKQKVAVKAR